MSVARISHPLVNKWLAAAKKAKELDGALAFDKTHVLDSHISRLRWIAARPLR